MVVGTGSRHSTSANCQNNKISSPPSPPISLNIFTLNCWGLKYISKHRSARLYEIGCRIASASPSYDIVALQECWVYSDYLAIRQETQRVLPYAKFYRSGVLGGGLVILSRWPIVGCEMIQYKLNGRPTAFWRGDWYVGKGVAWAEIDVGGGRRVEVFNTHLHAPYKTRNGGYLCHRTAQAWQISKLIRSAVQKGHIPIALGDFNMLPSSLVHHIITTHGLVSDSWLSRYPSTPTTLTANLNASHNIEVLGATSDSIVNTWRMPAHKIDIPSSDTHDPRAQRIDYIFHSPRVSKVVEVKVGCTEPMKLPGGPHKSGKGVARGGMVSLSDHFSVQARLEIPPPRTQPQLQLITLSDSSAAEIGAQEAHEELYLSPEVLDEIQMLTAKHTKREEWEYTWRIAHFWISVVALVGIHVGVWWGTRYAGTAFLCTFLAWVVGVTGVMNGLIGFLFMGSELNALKEFDEEIRIYRQIAKDKIASGEGRARKQVGGAVQAGSAEERIAGEVEMEGVEVQRRRSG
ncbi:Endonuclease/exonuclease/phosphatase [Kalaharituber pfeilii]|nr:Endonuclease/exonuclease/phosphatase [Kalaharituber pfeilii]